VLKIQLAEQRDRAGAKSEELDDEKLKNDGITNRISWPNYSNQSDIETQLL